jgi:ADP-ribosylglycohydrolase
MTAALVAGMVGALQQNSDWSVVEKYMRETDPYNFNHILYVPRRLNEWLAMSHEFVKRADGNITALFRILESELQAKTWWEAWVPIVVVFSCAEIVKYDPLASIQLMIEFGHDTDSYAQLMGAIIGAIYGKQVFPVEMQNTVNKQMKKQFGQDINDWLKTIKTFNNY